MTQTKVIVGMASCGLAAGAQEAFDTFKEKLNGNDVVAELTICGCDGICFMEPMAKVVSPDGQKWTYGEVTSRRAAEIVERHLIGGEPIYEWTFEKGKYAQAVNAFMEKQVRIVMRNCGHINPENIDEYLERNGYQAIKKAVTKMTREEVIEEVTKSGLRGRGGAGCALCTAVFPVFPDPGDRLHGRGRVLRAAADARAGAARGGAGRDLFQECGEDLPRARTVYAGAGIRRVTPNMKGFL